MRRQSIYLLLVCGAFTALQFISCTDTDYDFDNLNKDAVFSPDGISVPVGSLDTIRFKKLLDNLGIENLYWDESGAGYLRESGPFDITLPDISNLDISSKAYNSDWSELSIPNVSGRVDGNFIYLPTSCQFPLEFSADLGPDWDIAVDSANLEVCPVLITITLEGVAIKDLGTKTQVTMEIGLSKHFESSSPLTIKKNLSEIPLTSGVYIISEAINVVKYRFCEPGETEIICNVTFAAGSNTQASADGPKYQLSVEADEIIPQAAFGKVASNQRISGEIDLSSLKDALDESDILKFGKPALKMTIATNLGADFNMENIKLTAGAEQSSGDPLLKFEKPPFSLINSMKETVYWLAADENRVPELEPENKFAQLDIAPLFSEIPRTINYGLNITSTDPVAYAKWGQALELDAGYELKVPLSFSQIRISLKDTLENLFTEDLIEHVFNTGAGSGDVTITSTCDVFVGGNTNDLKIKTKAYIINEDGSVNTDVEIKVLPEDGLSRGANTEFSVKIRKEDMKYMENARHLAFDFVLTGSDVEISANDYIFLKSVKIKKNGGIYFEF